VMNLFTYLVAVLGTIVVLTTLTLVYPSQTLAACSLTVTCPNGGSISCAGNHCETYGNGKCCRSTINGQIQDNHCCQGEMEVQ
jgi:hypothetical protein